MAMRQTPFTAAVKSARPGDVIYTRQSDRAAAGYAIRAGFTCETRNFWVVPISAPHGKRAAVALRMCELTITGYR